MLKSIRTIIWAVVATCWTLVITGAIIETLLRLVKSFGITVFFDVAFHSTINETAVDKILCLWDTVFSALWIELFVFFSFTVRIALVKSTWTAYTALVVTWATIETNCQSSVTAWLALWYANRKFITFYNTVSILILTTVFAFCCLIKCIATKNVPQEGFLLKFTFHYKSMS